MGGTAGKPNIDGTIAPNLRRLRVSGLSGPARRGSTAGSGAYRAASYLRMIVLPSPSSRGARGGKMTEGSAGHGTGLVVVRLLRHCVALANRKARSGGAGLTAQ